MKHVLGEYTITTEHLRQLIKLNSKDKHCLTLADIDIRDKMKFRPTLKMIQPEVLIGLEEHIPNSKGTVLFLTIMRRIYKAFLDESLSVKDRVYEIW